MAHQSKNHVPTADVQIFPFSFDICSFLLLKTISGIQATWVADQLLWLDLFLFMALLTGQEFPLSAITNCFVSRFT